MVQIACRARAFKGASRAVVLANGAGSWPSLAMAARMREPTIRMVLVVDSSTAMIMQLNHVLTLPLNKISAACEPMLSMRPSMVVADSARRKTMFSKMYRPVTNAVPAIRERGSVRWGSFRSPAIQVAVSHPR